MKQYMPKKPTKRGFKVWVRADSSNGYVCQFQCYTGKEGNTTEVGLGGNVVSTLNRELSRDDLYSLILLLHQVLTHY